MNGGIGGGIGILPVITKATGWKPMSVTGNPRWFFWGVLEVWVNKKRPTCNNRVC